VAGAAGTRVVLSTLISNGEFSSETAYDAAGRAVTVYLLRGTDVVAQRGMGDLSFKY
jgi:hypothetical protein